MLRGPPFCMKLTSFVRPALRASSAPTTKNRSRSRAGPLKAGRVLRGHPSGLGLDRPEHGGRISQSGRKRAHSSKFKPLVFGYFHAAANSNSKSVPSTGLPSHLNRLRILTDDDVAIAACVHQAPRRRPKSPALRHKRKHHVGSPRPPSRGNETQTRVICGSRRLAEIVRAVASVGTGGRIGSDYAAVGMKRKKL